MIWNHQHVKRKGKIAALVMTAALIAATGAVNLPGTASTEVQAASSARQVESLDRGLVGVKNSSGIFLSWRLLGTEEYSTKFNVYRDGKKIASNISNSTNYTDKSGSTSSTYYVTSVVNGVETTKSDGVKPWANQYFDISIHKPAGGTNKSGSYTYSANDASVADVDGDGQYEILLKWDPSNSKDNSQKGYTGNVYLDAYKMDGTQLWRIDLGCNIRAGAHYTQFIAYDFNGDGKAEVACRTAYGTKDGTGQYANDPSSTNNTKDYRNSSGYVLSGTEFLTMFDGKTGDTLQSIQYTPQRGTVKSWGDSYGNRVDRFLGGVAYLDGKTPSLIMCRGYYTRAVIAAYTWNGSSFKQQWVYDTGSSTSGTSTAYGQGTHSLSVADVDQDGYDEIVYGSAVIDHNGRLLYSTGHGHGDALHVSDFNNDGKQEVFMVHEEAKYYKSYGAELRDAGTGKILAKVGASADVGRGVMANVTSASGAEFWSTADNNLYNAKGTVVGSRPSPVNFSILWDGDLLSELLDGTKISKYNESTKRTDTVLNLANVHSNNTTKATPCLQADLFGDWREEVIMAGSDDTFLRVYTTNIETSHKLYTLMHDTQYRAAIAWQNVAYNQPPHTSYYIGEDMSTPKKPSVYTVGSKHLNDISLSGIESGATYTIQNQNSQLFLNVYGGRQENGTNVLQYAASKTVANERWKLVSNGDGYYKVISAIGDGNTYALDVTNSSSASGINMIIWNSWNTDGQLFKFVKNSDGTYTIYTKCSSDTQVLDVEGGSKENNGNVQTWGYAGSSNQKWILKKVS